MKKTVLFFLLISLKLTKNVYAYVDPGVGGTLYQIVILILGGIGIIFIPLKRILPRIFRKNKSKKR